MQAVEVGSESITFHLARWKRHLRTGNRSPHTIRNYDLGVRSLRDFLAARGMPTEVEHITREHVEEWTVHILETASPATAKVYAGYAKRFFSFLVEQGELRRSPMEKSLSVKVKDRPPDVLSDLQVRAILKQCEGSSFLAKRDQAMIRVLLDTGIRRGECANIQLVDVDLDSGVIVVRGKTGERLVGVGNKTISALDRYLSARRKHPKAHLDALWLGKRGPLTPGAVGMRVVEIAARAGVEMHTHELRHTHFHLYLSAGGSEGGAMALGGWRSNAMLFRYGRAQATKRALDEHRRLGVADKF